MTLIDCATEALKRAHYCRLHRKNSTQHYREAALTIARILASENQRNGHSYKRETLRILSAPTKGIRQN